MCKQKHFCVPLLNRVRINWIRYKKSDNENFQRWNFESFMKELNKRYTSKESSNTSRTWACFVCHEDGFPIRSLHFADVSSAIFKYLICFIWHINPLLQTESRYNSTLQSEKIFPLAFSQIYLISRSGWTLFLFVGRIGLFRNDSGPGSHEKELCLSIVGTYSHIIHSTWTHLIRTLYQTM